MYYVYCLHLSFADCHTRIFTNCRVKLIVCKDNANESNGNLLTNCRVKLIVCKDNVKFRLIEWKTDVIPVTNRFHDNDTEQSVTIPCLPSDILPQFISVKKICLKKASEKSQNRNGRTGKTLSFPGFVPIFLKKNCGGRAVRASRGCESGPVR